MLFSGSSPHWMTSDVQMELPLAPRMTKGGTRVTLWKKPTGL